MANMIPFLSKLLKQESLRNAFVKDTEGVLAKHALDPKERKVLTTIANTARKAKNATASKVTRTKNQKKVLAAIAGELDGLGKGKHDPHW